jgi:CO dehydrogenase maturation factor
MRVAFVGKGGSGKSSIAGTMARLLARTGRPVLAVDSDPMPGLAFSLGCLSTDAGIPDDAVEEFQRDDGRRGYRFPAGVALREVVEAYAASAPDGVRLLQLGKARGPRWENSRPHAAFQQILDHLPSADWEVVGDLPGGTRQPFMTWARYADVVAVVAEPTPASLLTARRLSRLQAAAPKACVLAVASKTREEGDAAWVAEATGLRLAGALPLDPVVHDADRHGRPVLDHAPDSAYVEAARSLLARLTLEEAR